jgi:hypothetical protein
MRCKKLLVVFVLCIQCFLVRAKDYPVALFNIHSDGITLNTRSIQFAIDCISQNGGGRLVFDLWKLLNRYLIKKSKF